ncbi:MAG: metallopeptidase family protein [Corynebacterium humireducens]|jgi:predicted Zn-dependent protease with MMP-like domain|uniref:Metallopeptidase family protein n=1 Tax=Corynebacterium humireducens TaxID=1223514 RepID=A0A7X6SUM4_9CORY|nr:metallopeptidase family protein [Corynebacterium sp.]NLA55263.1 metallopeptidase family protein [Corynebacterium humireducens]HHU66396.1 metallopeptidase family protein [Corynebacterium sp.]HKM25668.1 metallopeptidase family protein [Corynebacterium sp.]
MVDVSDEAFEEMVNDALDMIPDEFARELRNVAIQVADYNEEHPSYLGLYVGVSLPERTHHHSGFLPDAIFIYKESLKRYARSVEDLREQVKVTVFHEVGHYFGLEEEDLERLGWG